MGGLLSNNAQNSGYFHNFLISPITAILCWDFVLIKVIPVIKGLIFDR